MELIINWIKANKTLALIAGAAILLFFFGKKLFPAARRRRKNRTKVVIKNKPRRRSSNRVIQSGVNKGKKPWQIKGSPEARARMARLRRMRSK